MSAFSPKGPLLNFTAATSAPTSVQAISLDGVQEQQVVLTNTSGSVDAVIGWGTSDAIAKLAAAAGTSVVNCYYLMHGTQVTLTVPAASYFSGITSASTAVIYVQAGSGE